MSNLLSQASLVMIPSGYKEDVVYSQIPTDGSGDLSFTRASNGTRVNSAGLVEVCPWNLITYSEDFTNAVWTKVSATVTANSTTAPNGTNTATKFESVAAGVPQLSRSIAGTNTISIYAKAGNINNFRIWIGSEVIFDLSTGTVTAGTATMENVGNGWYRCIISATSAASVNPYFVSTASGQFVYVWGAQLNIGSTAKPYFPTTDRLNVPRLTYQNGGGGCPSLLLEKQSTNINIYSEDFSNGAYSTQNCTITTNQTTSPDGTTNADKLTDNSTNSYHIIYPNTLSITASKITASVYVKNNDIQFCAFQLATSIVGTYDTRFTFIADLVNATITDTEQVGTPNAVYSIQNVGNGWYRLNLTCDHSAGQVAFVVGGSNSGTPSSYTDALPTYVGTGKSLFVWGAQIEASSYPTSYIPTTSSSATRVADACFKTGISSLIGQTEGTIFADITPQIFNNSAYQTVAIIYPNAGLGGTYFHFYKNLGTTNLFFEVWNASSQCSMSYTMANNTRYKVAAVYKNNDFALYVNGVQVGSDNSGTVASVTYSTLEMGYDSFNTNPQMSLSEFVLFPTRLTNAELASLTTI
jgi:hypothetical protein